MKKDILIRENLLNKNADFREHLPQDQEQSWNGGRKVLDWKRRSPDSWCAMKVNLSQSLHNKYWNIEIYNAKQSHRKWAENAVVFLVIDRSKKLYL